MKYLLIKPYCKNILAVTSECWIWFKNMKKKADGWMMYTLKKGENLPVAFIVNITSQYIMTSYFLQYWPFARGIHRKWYQREVMKNFDVFVTAGLNKLLNKHVSDQWF